MVGTLCHLLNCTIALAAIAACLICIYMVFVFGRKVSDTTYVRAELVENLIQTEDQKRESSRKRDRYGCESEMWELENMARPRSQNN
jgi:hypothetical protein